MKYRFKIGISACLLGNKVRYDGAHAYDRYLEETIGKFVEWVAVCPEVECGLQVPREPMRLEGNPASPRLLTKKTGIDHTNRINGWCKKRLIRLKKEDISGFIFKSRSPSCGLRSVKVYMMPSTNSIRTGRGIFAEAFIRRFPGIPVEDEDRLIGNYRLDNFMERVFMPGRWKSPEDGSKTAWI
ncbi:hypothetical protein BMS3Abin07_01113 [bacterium BMS3Abin07]|nr:hypothetical protein BMS3Abin07_01113 [bacterium BMS3Abin07]GBE31612.1 hypothetical protein BMS3Bbin05_00515 [bacterium BMS3Bbin05]HDO21724.1 DUF523 domain-containing protein [Nitrospirota bacterium]HDZ87894.1 DUF523 domain-containing protein [Nitrospirota bacterium]